jgi:NAD(P)-dependent dehydrogenase (short-subunit alcohol dehydrogenase family)
VFSPGATATLTRQLHLEEPMPNPMSYEDKIVVVTGGSSGVGASLVDLVDELGASEILTLDLNAPDGGPGRFMQCDMSDPASVDAVAAAIDGPIDVLFNNAGVAATLPAPQVMRVNLFGLLRLTTALLPKISDGGAIINTASIAGMQWATHLTEITELLAIDDWDKQQAWVEDNGELVGDGYGFSKECVQVLTMLKAKELIGRGIRIASACPAPIDTPLLVDFKETMSEKVIDWTIGQATGEYVTAREVANLLAYLGSDAAKYVSGVNVNIDGGFEAAMTTGQVDFSGMA